MSLALFLGGALLFVAIGLYLNLEARRVRRESERELARERESMRQERAAYAEERMQLVDRLMWASGKPWEGPPVWERQGDERREEGEIILLEPEFEPVE